LLSIKFYKNRLSSFEVKIGNITYSNNIICLRLDCLKNILDTIFYEEILTHSVKEQFFKQCESLYYAIPEYLKD